MTKKKTTKKVEKEVIEVKEEKKVEKKAVKSSILVQWRGREREYTLKEHGKDFMLVAQSFSDNVGGILV